MRSVNRVVAFLCLLALSCASAFAQVPQVNIINTIAGGAPQPGPATSAYLPQPTSVVRDNAGNTYIAVPALYTVYVVNTGGSMSVYAGTGVAGFSGDGGPATQAQLAFPQGLAIDSANNLYIADADNERIRRVDAQTHIITTVAGNEDPFFGAYAGDGGPATGARLNLPTDVAVDTKGNLFIADNGNGVVRRVDAATQIITTYAGSTGDVSTGCNSGSATNFAFGNLIGVAVDSSGNLFASDTKLDIVCKIDTNQNVTLYAGTIGNPGTPGAANGDGGPATSAQIDRPTGLATDAAGNLYITDSGNPRIRKVDTSASNIITSVAGTGVICPTASESACGDGGPATGAAFDFPNGVFVDANNNILVADTNNMRVRVISAATSIITNLAGSGSGGDGGQATSSILGLAQSLVVDATENVFALESAGERLRKIDTSGNINTIAGTGFGGQSRNCGSPCNGDGGPATAAQFVEPEGLATDAQGNFYIVDTKAEVVRVINEQTSPITIAGIPNIQPGDIATVAGNGSSCSSAGTFPTCGDGAAATSASLEKPFGIAIDAAGNIYISDHGLHTVRVVNSTGTITTFAGTPGQACTTYPTKCGDGGAPTAANALLNSPSGLAVSPTISQGVLQPFSTDVFIADTGDNAIRKVRITSGAALIETLSNAAFTGLPTFGGDADFSSSASMEAPLFVAVDNFESLYVGGGAANVVRRIDGFNSRVSTIAGDINNLDGGFSGDGGPSTQAMIQNTGLAVFNTQPGTHDVFIADSGSNRIRKVNLAPVSSIFPSSGTTITFPVTLDTQTNTQSILLENTGLDDLVINNVSLSDTTDFSVASSGCSGTNPVFVVPPNNVLGFGECTLDVNFTPGANANGVITATLTFSTNDAANPTLTYNLSGTATPTSFTLSVTLTPAAGSFVPGGSVISSDGKIDCSSDFSGTCSAGFPSGSMVTLFASADTGFVFSAWGGACAGVAGTFCTVPMTQAQSVSATFTANTPPPPPTMTINIVGLGSGSGMVTDSTKTINCTITNGTASGSCSGNFSTAGPSPSPITLTATPPASFVGWLGNSCSAYTNPCSIFPQAGTFVVGSVFTGPAQMFAKGQVFLSTDAGMVFVLDGATGKVVQVLGSNPTTGHGQGLTFDAAGNLYMANPQFNEVEQFSVNGTVPPAQFGSSYQRPWSLLVQPSGDLLVGQPGFEGDGFTPSTFVQMPQGATSTTPPSATFFPGSENFLNFNGVSWIELLDSGDTVAYTTGSQSVQVYDLGEQVQHPDLITSLNAAYALRELPDDTLLVADTGRIVRIDQSGNIKQIYTVPSTEATFINLNLDPDGQSFWTNDENTGILYRINIQTGAVMNGNGYPTGLGSSAGSGLITQGIGGIAVFGQALAGGADLAVTMTAPTAVNSGSNVTYSLTASNSGPQNATGVMLTTTISNSSVVSLSPNTCTSTTNAQGTTVSCPIGSLAVNGSTSATFTMLPNNPGTITATANIAGLESDPNLANNTATATTSTGPACTLSVTPNPGVAGIAVTATSNCTDAAGTITNTTLNFGDGSAPVNGTSAQHVYAAANTYTVTVTATDNLNLTGTATQSVTVSTNLPPTCSLTIAPNSGPFPLNVTATGNCTDPENDITSTSLDFGDGTVVNGATSGAHTYAKAGTFTVKVTATDVVGNVGSATQVVTVTPNLPPICTLTVAPSTGVVPLSVTATGNCTDPENDITSTTLDFGDGTSQTATSGTHSYTKAGVFTVTVTAVDGVGQKATATQTVTVGSSLAPICTLTVTPASGQIPLAVTATGNCTGTNTITTTVLNFGDGTTANASSGTHTYSQAGTFTVTLTATDSFGLTGSATQTVVASSNNFPQGVYIGVSGGKIMQFDSTGKALQTLDTTLGGTIADMAFDKAGNLYSVDFTAANVSKFNLTSGTLTGTFGSGYDCQPESMVFDGAGNAYVGQQGCAQTILKFDPKGNFLGSFQVATEQQGSDDLALSADECTMLYTSEGPSILRYDVCQKKQLAPFATGLNTALQLKILPDGGVLVADLRDIVRFNSSGQRMTTYTVPNQTCLYGIALDQDGTTFWTDDYCSSNIDHIDINSGKVLSTFNTGTPSSTVFGLAIAGSGLNVAGVGSGGSLTASPQSATLNAGQSATFTVTFIPNASAAGRTVVLSCAGLPPGLTCSFNPATITLGAAGTPTTATLTIARTTTAALLHPGSPWMWATWTGVVPAIVLMGLRSPRRRRGSMICLALVVAMTGVWASCGGGGGSNPMTTATTTTPPGSYTIIVVGNASGVQASTTVNVTAQ